MRLELDERVLTPVGKTEVAEHSDENRHGPLDQEDCGGERKSGLKAGVPSIIRPLCLHHFQACSPARPSMVSRIPAARGPPNTLDRVCAPCQTAMRKGNSSLTYQDEVIRATPGLEQDIILYD
jgi:hypothetical protein